MIDNTPARFVFIRVCIAALQYAPAIELLLVTALGAVGMRTSGERPSRYLLSAATISLICLLTAETAYYFALYLPHKARLLRAANYPLPTPRAERERVFKRCLANIIDSERYLRLWFLGAGPEAIKRENVREFFSWAFFDTDSSRAVTEAAAGGRAENQSSLSREDHHEELESYITLSEECLGWKFAPGRGPAKSLRLTIDKVETKYRSIVWYGVIGLVDFCTHIALSAHGFAYFAPPLRKTLAVFPPRLQASWSLLPFPGIRRHRSPSAEFGYWFREHTSKTRRPVVFLHGIGVGLWPYADFLGELTHVGESDGSDDGQVGVLILEILPICARLTTPLVPREQFLEHMRAILVQHGQAWEDFVLVSHSYGSVLTTHILQSPDLAARVGAVVLVDPVSVLLHLPDVAYNFTRRKPRRANEWQLWYFASTDLGVAEGLGRHFFWRENIIWRDELQQLGLPAATKTPLSNSHISDAKRQVAACLSGKDLIVDTQSVARYLASEGDLKDVVDRDNVELDHILKDRVTDNRSTCRSYSAPSGIDILWFPQLDHAQLFERKDGWRQVIDVINRYTIKDAQQ